MELACFGAARESFEAMALSRTLQRASLIRGEDGIGLFRGQGLEAAAGIRQVVSDFTARTPGYRMIGAGFMQIRQALGTTRTRGPARRPRSGSWPFVEDLKASGFIGDALRRSGQDGALVAPPEPRN